MGSCTPADGTWTADLASHTTSAVVPTVIAQTFFDPRVKPSAGGIVVRPPHLDGKPDLGGEPAVPPELNGQPAPARQRSETGGGP